MSTGTTTLPASAVTFLDEQGATRKVNYKYFTESSFETVSADKNIRLVTKQKLLSEYEKFAQGLWRYLDYSMMTLLLSSLVTVVAAGLVYINFKDSGLSSNQARTYIELTTVANQPSYAASSAAANLKDNHMIIQAFDLVAIALIIVAYCLYRYSIDFRARKPKYRYPRPENYTVKVKNLPSDISAKDFSARFINKDNVIQTAVVKNCGVLYRVSMKLFETDKKIKELAINLMEGDHVAKTKKTINRAK